MFKLKKVKGIPTFSILKQDAILLEPIKDFSEIPPSGRGFYVKKVQERILKAIVDLNEDVFKKTLTYLYFLKSADGAKRYFLASGFHELKNFKQIFETIGTLESSMSEKFLNIFLIESRAIISTNQVDLEGVMYLLGDYQCQLLSSVASKVLSEAVRSPEDPIEVDTSFSEEKESEFAIDSDFLNKEKLDSVKKEGREILDKYRAVVYGRGEAGWGMWTVRYLSGTRTNKDRTAQLKEIEEMINGAKTPEELAAGVIQKIQSYQSTMTKNSVFGKALLEIIDVCQEKKPMKLRTAGVN